jgi:DNA polymerase V
MASTKINRPAGKPGDLSHVIAFHAGTEWSSEMHLDLNEHLITHPSATFFLRVKGNSPFHGAIRNDDILIVDRSLTPHAHSMIIAVIDGALVIVPHQSLSHRRSQSEDGNQLDGSASNTETAVWGVVTYAIHKI